MLNNWFFATAVDEVGISWFDFYSVGHLAFGISIFLFFSLFYTIPKHKGYTPILSLTAVFIICLIVLVLWEILENTIFMLLGWKFEGRADSLQNVFTDIMIGIIGSLATWLFAYITFEKDKKILAYYIFGLISFGLWLGIFMILRYITLVNSPIIS